LDFDKCADDLVAAVDNAIVALQSTPGYFANLKAGTGNSFSVGAAYTHPPSINVHGTSTCFPDPTKWAWPKGTEAKGLLRRVLDSNEIRVASTQWGSYSTSPDAPIHFWASYLEDIIGKISLHYRGDASAIKLTRVYYSTSDIVTEKVAVAEEVEMSEPYYAISGFTGSEPRTRQFDFSCVTAGTESYFYVKKGSSIKSIGELSASIAGASTQPKIGFVSAQSYNAVASLLPFDFVTAAIDQLPTESHIMAAVTNGTYLSGYLSTEALADGDPTVHLNTNEFDYFPSGLVTPRVILFRGKHTQSSPEQCDTCSADLVRAVDSAIAHLHGTPSYFANLAAGSGKSVASTDYTHNASTTMLGAFTCSPSTNDDVWTWPVEFLTEADGGLLKRVLEGEEIRVASTKEMAAYTTGPDTPVHFWASYLQDIVDKLSQHYKSGPSKIKLTRVYYDSMDIMYQKVAEGKEVEMSEPFYALSGFSENQSYRQSLDFSCVTAGTESYFYVKNGSNITSVDELSAAIAGASAQPKIGFTKLHDYKAVASLFPSPVDAIDPVLTKLMAAVTNGTYLSGYLSAEALAGRNPADVLNTAAFDYFPSGLVNPRVILFPKDQNQACIMQPTAAPTTPTASPTKPPTKHWLSGVGTYAPTKDPTKYLEVVPTNAPTAVSNKISASMVLSGFTADTFTEKHQTGFKRAVATTVGVDASQVAIISVSVASTRRQLADGLTVNFEIIGLTTDKSSHVTASIAEVATDSASFVNTLTSAFNAAGAAAPPADFGVTAFVAGAPVVLGSPSCNCPEEGFGVGALVGVAIACTLMSMLVSSLVFFKMGKAKGLEEAESTSIGYGKREARKGPISTTQIEQHVQAAHRGTPTPDSGV
jgi:hypothetical protein